MRKPCDILHLCLLPLLLLLPPTAADVGTAASYGPPYLPTVCYGSDSSQFPADGLFGAAGEGIWDNGASCGRVYLLRCLSSTTPGACAKGKTIQVVIVDQAAGLSSAPSSKGTTMVLSQTPFQMISSPSAKEINIELITQ